MWFGANVQADSEIDHGRIRPLESTDGVDRGVMALDLGGLARVEPVFAVRPVGMLHRVVGPDGGKAHINLRAGYLAPSSVAFKGRKSARFCWVS